ncbi:hypothetical protein TRAPUB_8379 [Trametes pubescens]|uniref:Uncharacterized protein n=1 Tax=Trametes pubescens TaxID=154538 RepID=A0A1M2W5M3_TRAPU|nr:hypothetical protein TRAPUB_8379 [Trametes pubescens]
MNRAQRLVTSRHSGPGNDLEHNSGPKQQRRPMRVCVDSRQHVLLESVALVKRDVKMDRLKDELASSTSECSLCMLFIG